MSASILVVDDEPDVLDAICDVLELEGYHVRRARNGIEALDAVRAEPHDLIVLDLMMPVMDGYQFLAQLPREPLCASPPVLVLTADARAHDHALAAGAAASMAKPFNIDELAMQIKRLLSWRP